MNNTIFMQNNKALNNTQNQIISIFVSKSIPVLYSSTES